MIDFISWQVVVIAVIAALVGLDDFKRGKRVEEKLDETLKLLKPFELDLDEMKRRTTGK